MYKINFVSPANARVASFRMRILRPIELLNNCSPEFTATVNTLVDLQADVNIFSKHFQPEENLQGIMATKTHPKSLKSVFDICDDHFDDALGPYYKQMCQYADVITCNTFNMAVKIKEATDKSAFIIPDPITFPERPYKEPEDLDRPSLLWFGNSSNAEALRPWLDALPLEARVTAVTDAKINHPKVVSVVWEPQLTEEIIKDFDIVLLPTQKTEAAQSKSPNRAVDAIISGKIVITDNTDIYSSVLPFMCTIEEPDELVDALKYWKNHQKEMKDKVEAGQNWSKQMFSNDVVLDGWLEVLKELKVINDYKA